MLQVLVSIQSLIFVAEPYFNEPGYESSMHSESGKTASRNYSQNIRVQSIRWAMTEQLKSPSKGFEDAIETHFLHRANYALKEIVVWLDEADQHNSTTHKSRLEEVTANFIEQLKLLFEKYKDSDKHGEYPSLEIPEKLKKLDKSSTSDNNDDDNNSADDGFDLFG
mmetsp:Transcript_5789/g.8931  ORF Transcript_5789/g.8931 Transcript_5789/m.8931 type:complete len:166 (+) Transcript_5789:354-851(+)